MKDQFTETGAPDSQVDQSDGFRSANMIDLVNRVFTSTLLRNLHEGIGFIDLKRRVLVWNDSAERITGLSQKDLDAGWSIQQITRLPHPDQQCPVSKCLTEKIESESHFKIARGFGDFVEINLRAVPLRMSNGRFLGALLTMDDRSSERRLEEQVDQLHQQATTDPLTGVRNRQAFDEKLQNAFKEFRESHVVSSLVICDIDFFKRINDDYGHQKGDLALISFARHLTDQVRDDDIVARYGGEEFVIICHDCDRKTASERAERIREGLQKTPQPDLDGKCLTASFGVAQIMDQDNEESLFVRADHALLTAKESGRNCVVSANLGEFNKPTPQTEQVEKSHNWKPLRGEPIVQEEYMTPTPPDVLLAKIRGFIEDQSATIQKISAKSIVLMLGGNQSLFRRSSDQSIGLIVDIEMCEEARPGQSNRKHGKQTLMRCTIRPRRRRDRRAKELGDAANHIMSTLRSYLMIADGQLPKRAATKPGEGRT